MLAEIAFEGERYRVDLSRPLDISIPMESGARNPNAFGIQAPLFEPFRAGGFVGSVAEGGSVNCENLLINAHGNGTHTECVGHISKERITIHQALTRFMFPARLITVRLKELPGGDRIIALSDVIPLVSRGVTALVIRALPNGDEKLTGHYSGNNPAYVEEALCKWLCANGIRHLVIDLPSVDREEDGGALLAHHAFWNYPANPRLDATITEMAYIPQSTEDGLYVLNLQIASLQTDASPSKPVLYKLEHAV